MRKATWVVVLVAVLAWVGPARATASLTNPVPGSRTVASAAIHPVHDCPPGETLPDDGEHTCAEETGDPTARPVHLDRTPLYQVFVPPTLVFLLAVAGLIAFLRLRRTRDTSYPPSDEEQV